MRVHILTATLWAIPLLTQAQWTQYTLPDTASGSQIFDHLNDGRFVYNDSGTTIIQDLFGAATYSSHSASAAGPFPSFLEIRTDNTALAGSGSALFEYNAADLPNTAVTNIGATAQNYDGALRDNSGLFITGANGTGTFPPFSSPSNAVSYIDLTTGADTLLIDNISTYSAALAIDSLGDLYVGNNDNGIVRKFTAAQLSASISGGPAINFSDGNFIHDFGDGGNISSLAIDGQGRLWSAGYLQTGLQIYDPALNQTKHITPDLPNANYTVATFTTGGTDYISYINSQSGFNAGRAATYGYIDASTVMVPEPNSILLLIIGSALLLGWRRIDTHTHRK